MIKIILTVLFALTSSSALAQRHVPGGGPVGSPGNPGTRGPIVQPMPAPRYPVPSYPTPQYPSGYQNPCVISESYSGGYTLYSLFDGFGQFVLSDYTYDQVLYQAQMVERSGRCYGVRLSSISQQATRCTVQNGGDAYGNQFYRVLDSAGRIIYNSSSYQQAVDFSYRDSRCYQ